MNDRLRVLSCDWGKNDLVTCHIVKINPSRQGPPTFFHITENINIINRAKQGTAVYLLN